MDVLAGIEETVDSKTQKLGRYDTSMRKRFIREYSKFIHRIPLSQQRISRQLCNARMDLNLGSYDMVLSYSLFFC